MHRWLCGTQQCIDQQRLHSCCTIHLLNTERPASLLHCRGRLRSRDHGCKPSFKRSIAACHYDYVAVLAAARKLSLRQCGIQPGLNGLPSHHELRRPSRNVAAQSNDCRASTHPSRNPPSSGAHACIRQPLDRRRPSVRLKCLSKAAGTPGCASAHIEDDNGEAKNHSAKSQGPQVWHI